MSVKDIEFKIESLNRLVDGIYEINLSGDGGFSAPGQFINMTVDSFFLRRPIPVCDYSKGRATIIFRASGGGTTAIARMKIGETIKALSPLGNGFNLDSAPSYAAVIGGGVGIPPLYGLTKGLLRRGCKVSVVLGFQSASDVFYADEFTALGVKPMIYTEDGSLGAKGRVTDAVNTLPAECAYLFTCGPLPMLKALYAESRFLGGQFSVEERMGCGFGACVCCSIQTRNGTKKVCTDGPVFYKEDLIW